MPQSIWTYNGSVSHSGSFMVDPSESNDTQSSTAGDQSTKAASRTSHSAGTAGIGSTTPGSSSPSSAFSHNYSAESE
ncbi:uncharacterized protein L201_000152 [Kwoniella dendrophila CBS 6074]|uniref:Uncharacterized protein n=1 Tax=Kwoniella dendrophila CBS 6074 TaxID=1295534 RepID=A0AAX4JKX5_9TREE